MTLVKYRDAVGNRRSLTVKAVPAEVMQMLEGLVGATRGNQLVISVRDEDGEQEASLSIKLNRPDWK
jgi:hypothetical protein